MFSWISQLFYGQSECLSEEKHRITLGPARNSPFENPAFILKEINKNCVMVTLDEIVKAKSQLKAVNIEFYKIQREKDESNSPLINELNRVFEKGIDKYLKHRAF